VSVRPSVCPSHASLVLSVDKINGGSYSFHHRVAQGSLLRHIRGVANQCGRRVLLITLSARLRLQNRHRWWRQLRQFHRLMLLAIILNSLKKTFKWHNSAVYNKGLIDIRRIHTTYVYTTKCSSVFRISVRRGRGAVGVDGVGCCGGG